MGQDLEDEVDVLLVVEKSVELGQMLMLQIRLYLDLSQNSILKFLLLNLAFGNLLQHTKPPSRLLNRHKHISKGPLTNLLNQLKILNRKLLPNRFYSPSIIERTGTR